MKRYFIFLVISVLITFFVPRYYKTIYIIRHVTLYILIASIIILIINKIYNNLINKYEHIFKDKKLVIFRVSTIFVLIGLLGLVRYTQVSYIKFFESPPTVFCYYYDEYGNFIHGSRISYVCPTLEIIDKTDNSLTFKAEYKYPGNRQDYFRGSSSMPYSYRGKDGYAIVDVDIKYNDNYITSYTTKTSMNYELFINPITDSKEVRKFYHSQMIQINTTYTSDSVTQTKKSFIKEIDNVSYNNITDVQHFDFTNTDPISDRELELQVTNKNSDYIEFEVYNSNLDNKLYYLGNIDYSKEDTTLFYMYNPEHINKAITPREFSNTYTMNGNTISKKSIKSFYTYTYEYKSFKDYIPMIETFDSNEKERKIYILNDSVIIDGQFRNYKIYKTNYGYKVEQYQGDGHVKEIPYSDDYYLTSIITGIHGGVYEDNPIKLDYDEQPVINLNPMLKYILEENKNVKEYPYEKSK